MVSAKLELGGRERESAREANSHFTHETEGPWPLHSKISHWSKRSNSSKFTSLEGEDLRVQRDCHGWKVYMDSYVANYG